ncbi:MAG: hypothetical protein U1A27_14795 [Phycisphaerae bacterium]
MGRLLRWRWRESATPTRGDISPNQTLVVYNSAAAESLPLLASYLAAHPGIPPENVLDLNYAGLLTPDVTYATFVQRIRDPIRAYLAAPGLPDPSSIILIVILRPFPHRVQDPANPGLGDSPSAAANAFVAGRAGYASVDSELTLLWQPLDSGEAGGTMDSKSDNAIVNPYHGSPTPIDTISRANILTAQPFTNVLNVAWFLDGTTMTPGDMYLVCRVDGTTLSDAQALISRAAGLYVNKNVARALFDEYNTAARPPLDDDSLFTPPSADPFWGGPDYDDAQAVLVGAGFMVRHDETFNFITGPEDSGRLILYASYGENHSLGGAGEDPPGLGVYIDTFAGKFVRGAIFNTIESFNCRAFGGLGTMANQEQAADFFAVGGTFAVGSVWEPLSGLVPDNEFVAQNFLVNNRTWAEAAWSAIPALSWATIAVGDPLAKAAVIADPGLPTGDMNGDGFVRGDDVQWFVTVLNGGEATYRAAFPALDPLLRGDFTGDYQVHSDDIPGFIAALMAP